MKYCVLASASGIQRRKSRFGIALLALPLLLGVQSLRVYGESANTDYKRGEAAEARQDYDAAYAWYQKAYQKDPQDLRFRTALTRLRTTDSTLHLSKGRQLYRSGDLQGALAEFLHASEIDPGDEAAQQEIAHVREAQGGTAQPAAEIGTPQPSGEQTELSSMGSPVQLKPVSNEPLTLHMNEDAKVVYQAIGKAAGINVLFDPDYNSKRIQVDLNNVSLLDALRIVGAMSNTFWRAVTPNTIFVAQNTRVKRTELDEQAVQTFYLTNAWQQNDLNDIQTALRNVLPNAKVYGVASQNAIVMRGTPDELLLASKLIDDLDKPRSEVVVDFGVLEVSKNWERTLGIAWPNSFGVTLQPSCAQTNTCSTASTSTTTTSTTTTTTSPSLYNLAHMNSTNFAVTVGSATLNLLLTDNNTKVLQSPRIRATDAQKATMKIGSRIPIATGSYSAPGLAATAAIGYAQTQFQYQDVGVNIEMTPSVHYDHDVTVKIKIEVSAESGSTTIEGVTEPIISQRVVDQVIRLREGEASILGGIQNKQEAENWTGLPGLSAIPIIKYIFGSKDRTIQDDDIVFVVVPHIVRSQELDQANLRVIDTGMGQNSIDLRHGGDAGGGTQPAVAPAVRTLPAAQSDMGSIPAQSAVEAAPEMLAQLRADMAATGGPTVPLQAPNAPQPTPAAAPPPVQPAAAPAAVAPTPAAVTPPAPQAAAPAVSAPTPAAAAPPVPQAAAPAAAAPTPAAASASLALNVPAAPVAAGSSFQVPVVLNGAADVTSVALQVQFDPARLQLVGAAAGDLLSRDGQPTGLSHVEEPAGTLVVSISRPPGTHGVTGSGVVCVLNFQAKAAGQSSLNITRAAVMNAARQQVPAQTGQAAIVVK